MLKLVQKSNSNTPSLQTVALEYLDRATKMVPNHPESEMVLIDSVRACMIIYAGYFSLGEIEKGNQVKGITFLILNLFVF